jgi:hypothetical protein
MRVDASVCESRKLRIRIEEKPARMALVGAVGTAIECLIPIAIFPHVCPPE